MTGVLFFAIYAWLCMAAATRHLIYPHPIARNEKTKRTIRVAWVKSLFLWPVLLVLPCLLFPIKAVYHGLVKGEDE